MLIPHVSINPEQLQIIDMDVRFQSDKVVIKGVPLDGLSTDLKLQDGHLKINSKLGLIGGTIEAAVNANSRETPMQSALTTSIRRVDILKIFTQLGMEQEAFGELDGQIELTGTGHTLADVLKSSDGRIVLTMAGGQLDSVIIELAGLDIGEALLVAFTDKNEMVPIRCLVMNLNAIHGKMQIECLILDTTDTKIVGKGFLDFGTERIDLIIEPRAKDFSVLSAESTFHVEGTFADISAGPKLGELLLSLAVPIEPGQGEDASCDELTEAAEQFYPQ